jgi:putative SOS response-associated peptidase YedK
MSGFAFRKDWKLASPLGHHHILRMCGRVIQSSEPLRYAIVDGMNVRDSSVHNYPPRWNAAPSQELLVIRRNHRTGEVSLDPLRWAYPELVQRSEWGPQANQRQVRDGTGSAHIS